MKAARTLAVLLLLLLAMDIAAPVCQAQVLPYSAIFALAHAAANRGTTVKYHQGSYQLADGSWQQGNWVVKQDKLNIIDLEKKKEVPKSYTPDEVQKFVAGTDTFLVVRNFDLATPATHVNAGFAQQLYRGGNFLLVEYFNSQPGAKGAKAPKLLVRGNEAPAVVPSKPREFREFMLPYVGDHPQIAKKLNDGTLRPDQAVEILTTYTTWKRYQPVPASGQE